MLSLKVLLRKDSVKSILGLLMLCILGRIKPIHTTSRCSSNRRTKDPTYKLRCLYMPIRLDLNYVVKDKVIVIRWCPKALMNSILTIFLSDLRSHLYWRINSLRILLSITLMRSSIVVNQASTRYFRICLEELILKFNCFSKFLFQRWTCIIRVYLYCRTVTTQ